MRVHTVLLSLLCSASTAQREGWAPENRERVVLLKRFTLGHLESMHTTVIWSTLMELWIKTVNWIFLGRWLKGCFIRKHLLRTTILKMCV